MPTIIDSLILKLGLSSTDFEKGMDKVDKRLDKTGKEADKTGKTLQKSAKTGADGYENVTKAAMKFLALIGGTYAVKRFIEQTIESSAALERFSKNVGAAVETVSAWGRATELTGGSAANFQGTMQKLSMAQTEFLLTGDQSLIPYLSALNVSLSDGSGKARSLTDSLVEIGQALMSKMPSRQHAFNMGTMMGIDPGTLNLILQGRKEAELAIKRQLEMGVVTKAQAEAALRLQQSMIRAKQSFESFGRELLEKAHPALEKMAALFEDFGVWIKENQSFVEKFLTVMAAGLLAVGAALIPINLTVVAILGLGTAIALLWGDYSAWKKGADHLIPWDKWEPGITAAKESIKDLAKILGDFAYRYAASVDLVAAVVSGDWSRAKFAAGELLSGNGNGLLDAKNAGAASDDEMIANWNKRRNASGLFSAHEQKNNLPPGTLDSVWNAESGRGKHMLSPAGAQGHFQFMPGTARQYGLSDPNNLEQSAAAAAQYLGELRMKYGGDMGKALAAYNWGPGNVDRKGMGAAPTETLNYMRKVMGGIPGASGAAMGAGASSGGSGFSVPGSRTIQNNIGEIKVYTQATDADGIAADIGKSMESLFTSQANAGLF